MNIKFSHWRLIAVIYALILFLLNFIRIFDNNFWADEAYTATLVVNSVADIIKITAADMHPPLYYLLVKAGYSLFGNQGWMFHFVSLIPCAIIMIFALTEIWKKMGKETAFVLITFIGLSSNAVTYNVEVRMYSWGSLFILLTFYALYLILTEDKGRNYILFTAFSLAAAYTHYYCLLSVSFFYLALLFMAVCKKQLELKKVLLTCFCAILAYSPWFIILLQSMAKRVGNYWIEKIPTFKNSLGYLYSMSFDKDVCIHVGLLVIILYELGILKIIRKEKHKIEISFKNINTARDMIWRLVGIISILGTVTIAIVISKTLQPFYMLRYIYPVSVVAWIILGYSISKVQCKRVLMVLLMTGLLAEFIPGYARTYTAEKIANEKLQTTLQATEDKINKGDIILANNIHISRRIVKYYYPGTFPQYVELGKIPKLRKDKNYWIIVAGEKKMDAAFEQLKKQGFSWTLIVDDGNLGTNRVWIYKLDYKKR